MPLAVLGQLPQGVELEQGLASVVQRLVRRLWDQTPHDQAKPLIMSAYLLAGLRVKWNTADRLFRGVTVMEESSTYMAILDKGALRGIKKMLLMQGQIQFGPPDAAARAALEAVDDLEKLEALAGRLLKVHSWSELLASK